jgi:hypothetical protein
MGTGSGPFQEQPFCSCSEVDGDCAKNVGHAATITRHAASKAFSADSDLPPHVLM